MSLNNNDQIIASLGMKQWKDRSAPPPAVIPHSSNMGESTLFCSGLYLKTI